MERPKYSNVLHSVWMSSGTIWTLIPLQSVAAFHLLLFLAFREENLSVLAAFQLFITPIALTGLIGDIFLNKTPLRNFKIYSLEMKPDFLKRFVGFNNCSCSFETNCLAAVQNLGGSSYTCNRKATPCKSR